MANPTIKDVLAWRVAAGLPEWPTQASYDAGNGQADYDRGFAAGAATERARANSQS